MELISFIANLPLPVAIVIVVFIISMTVLGIIRLLAKSRVKTAETNLEIVKYEAQGKIRTAELLAEAQIKVAEMGLETAKQQTEAQRQALERETKLATELAAERVETAKIRLATATLLEAGSVAQMETAKALGSLTRGQKLTDTLVKGSESRLGVMIEGARDVIVEGIEEATQYFVMMLQLLWEDPAATRDRIKRFSQAWISGDVVAAQAVVDEDVPPPAAEAALT